MKSFLSKLLVPLTGMLALLGVSSGDVKARVDTETYLSKVTEQTPLYLAHAQDLTQAQGELAGHYSHYSHGSHQSHYSHQSHQSHYSSW